MINELKQVAADVPDTKNWKRAFTPSGTPAGLSFFCPICKLGIQYNAGEGESGGVFHCGALEKRPDALLTAEQDKAARSRRVRFI